MHRYDISAGQLPAVFLSARSGIGTAAQKNRAAVFCAGEVH
ncbi:MAG: hypothetical protein V4793_16455 [Paraburkholderia tropica]